MCNVNQVDGRLWKPEAVGSNPTMQTKLVSRWCNGSIAVSKTVGRGSSPWWDAKFLLGVRLVWSKATVFEIVITGSNPVPSASIPG